MLKKKKKVLQKLRENSADIMKTREINELSERTKSAIRRYCSYFGCFIDVALCREKLEENRRLLQEKAKQRMLLASEEMENPKSFVQTPSEKRTPDRRKSIPKPLGRSNKALIKNALIQVLGGPVYEKTKLEVLEVIFHVSIFSLKKIRTLIQALKKISSLSFVVLRTTRIERYTHIASIWIRRSKYMELARMY